MDLDARLKMSRVTLKILMILNSFFLTAAVVIALCVGLDLNPFGENTTSFLVASLMGSIGLAVATLFLNIASNLSLIAEKFSDDVVQSSSKSLRKYIVGTTSIVVAAVIIVIAGSKISDERVISAGRKQAEAVMDENQKMFEDILVKVSAIKKVDEEMPPEVLDSLNFLQHQRADLPSLTIITSTSYGNQRALFEFSALSEWEHHQHKECDRCKAQYFSCRAEIDCDYLKDVFSGKSRDPKTYFDRKRDELRLYFPVETAGTKAVLLFNRSQRYGKLGSL